MLETEEVDDDYFTPIPSTSLADIFGSSNHTRQERENTALTYTPPKPQDTSLKTNEPKATQCVFACTVLGYEWCNNVYSIKGKLGFAIIKTLHSNDYNIVLYDSSKTTLSLTNISPLLKITVKGNVYVSFYDKYGKYWSLYGTQEEMTKITEHLKDFNVIIEQSQHTDTFPPEPNLPDKPIINTTRLCYEGEKESDTDSSINTRTKASILSRMSNMGYSVLPPQIKTTEKISDSSDTNESDNPPIIMRHKTIKSIVKRNNVDRNVPEIKNSVENSQNTVAPRTDPIVDFYSYVNGQLVPVRNTNINNASCNSSDMNMFMSEQRTSNSELRININRIHDKMDKVLERVKDINLKGDIDNTTNFQVNILQKLLSEYENKIKSYEELIKTSDLTNYVNEVELHKKKISDLETVNKNKDIEISKLNNDIALLQSRKLHEEDLCKEVDELKRQLAIKAEELKTFDTEKNRTPHNNNYDLKTKIKVIMNDVYQAISANFDTNTNYSGDTVRNITATIMKRITTNSISEL